MARYVFRSQRLWYLAAGPDLAGPAAAFYRRNRAAFAPFDPVQSEDFFTEAGQAESLAAAAERAAEGRHPGKVVGLVGLNEIVLGAFRSCFLSYKIDRTLWGRGYGAEAIGAAAEWAFRVLKLHRVEANIMPRNLASRRAAEKAGFEEEGLSRRYLKINGVWEDHLHLVKFSDGSPEG